MRKISNYTILKADSIIELAKKVNFLIETGYEPIGGVIVDSLSDRECYIQAVVKVQEKIIKKEHFHAI